jgi:hypothetical protein
MQRGLALALVIALLALASVAEAWGPLSHYYFALQAFPTADPYRYARAPPHTPHARMPHASLNGFMGCGGGGFATTA